MAKRRSAGRDTLPNEHRFIHTMDAASHTVANNHTKITTGMLIGQGQQNRKWWLLGAHFQPEDADFAMSAAPVTAIGLKAQLALGDHTTDTAFLDHDDPQRICSTALNILINTQGGIWGQWPIYFPLPFPKPILAKELTFTLASTADDAAMDSADVGVTLVYVTDSVSGAEVGEMLAAYGQL